jgi:hypothetical protein
MAVHYGTSLPKIQIDNDVIRGILCFSVEGYPNMRAEIWQTSFAWQFAVREVKSGLSTNVTIEAD